jgi:cytochrome c5
MRQAMIWKFCAAALSAVFVGACSLVQPPDQPAADAAPAPASPPQPTTLKSTDDMVAKTVDFGPRDQMPGAPLYAEHCAACHNGGVPKAPHLTWLEMMSPRAIVRSLENGLMQTQGVALSA